MRLARRHPRHRRRPGRRLSALCLAAGAASSTLAGWVRNDADGVEIAVEGAAASIDALIARLRSDVTGKVTAPGSEDNPGLPG